MGPEEFISWLMKIGMGWLGWKPDEVLDADMTDVVLAYEGRVELIEIQLGHGGQEKGQINSVDDFDAVFG